MNESDAETRDATEATEGVAGDETQALEAAIAENPEEVAAFVRRLGLVNELLDATDLATSAMDDEMVTRLAGTSSLLVESADGLATPETASLAASVGDDAAEIESALETLVRLERAGTLEELADVADAATLLTAALDDEMVMRLARTGSSLGEVAETASEPGTARGVQTLLRAVGEANDGVHEPAGAMGLVRSLRDPDVRRGMGFLLAVAREIGRGVDRPE